MWDTSCLDWEDRILSGRPLVPDLPLFKDEAERALKIFKRLRIPDLIGQPIMGDACGPWFFSIVAALFGSYDPVAHTRVVQEFFLLIPKKNAKSSNGGAVMVTALIMNRRPEAEFLLVAPTMEIATIALKQAKGTIKADPALDALFQVQDHLKKITHRNTGATLQIKAADTDVITGSKALGTMIDETHVFAKHSRAMDVFVELRGALTARPDGFLFQTTTQSKEPPTGVFKAELARARAVRDGKMQLPMLPILYELPTRVSKDGGWKERRLWGFVNPNLNISVNEQFLANELMVAETEGPAKLALIASQHFNVEIGQQLREDRWPGADKWEAAALPKVTLEYILKHCDCATVGVDGGGLDDLFAVAVVGRERGTRRWVAWCKAWCQRSVLDLRKSEAQRLQDFEKQGDLVLLDIPGEDIEGVVQICTALDDAGILATIGMDPVGIGEVVDALEAAELGGDERIVGVSQGYKLMGASKTLERKLADGTFKHGGQEILSWAVGNAKIEQKGNAQLITKQASGVAKIDPLMALLNAGQCMALNPEPVNRIPEIMTV
jgi:phage terminase large subunit-like protein